MSYYWAVSTSMSVGAPPDGHGARAALRDVVIISGLFLYLVAVGVMNNTTASLMLLAQGSSARRRRRAVPACARSLRCDSVCSASSASYMRVSAPPRLWSAPTRDAAADRPAGGPSIFQSATIFQHLDPEIVCICLRLMTPVVAAGEAILVKGSRRQGPVIRSGRVEIRGDEAFHEKLSMFKKKQAEQEQIAARASEAQEQQNEQKTIGAARSARTSSSTCSGTLTCKLTQIGTQSSRAGRRPS